MLAFILAFMLVVVVDVLLLVLLSKTCRWLHSLLSLIVVPHLSPLTAALRQVLRNAFSKIAGHAEEVNMRSVYGSSYVRASTCPGLEAVLDNKGALHSLVNILRTTGSGSTIEALSVVPHAYVLPAESTQLSAAMRAHPEYLWILKPHALSYGSGMRVVRSMGELPAKGEGWHVQQYLHRPLTYRGHKVCAWWCAWWCAWCDGCCADLLVVWWCVVGACR